MRPLVSGKLDKTLQISGTNSFKDLYPPVNTELYYAVAMVNGGGQEGKDVDAKKVCDYKSVHHLFFLLDDKSRPLMVAVAEQRHTDCHEVYLTSSPYHPLPL